MEAAKVACGSLSATITVDAGAKLLVRTTVQALALASMEETLGTVHRMLNSTGRSLFDVTIRPQSQLYVHLQPYAELALRELRSIARSTGDAALKERKAAESLAIAGY